jgi:hypothetical protein
MSTLAFPVEIVEDSHPLPEDKLYVNSEVMKRLRIELMSQKVVIFTREQIFSKQAAFCGHHIIEDNSVIYAEVKP